VIGETAARRSSTARSAGLLYGAAVVGAALSLANVMVTARALGPQGRGAVAFLTTVGVLTSSLAVLGVQQSVANLTARRPARSPELAGTAAGLAFVLGVAAAAAVTVLVLAVPAAAAGSAAWLLALVLAALPVLVLQLCLQQLIGAHHRFRILTASSLLPPLVNTAGNSALVATGKLTVALAVGMWLAGQLLATALLVRTVRRDLGGFGSPRAATAREALAFGMRCHLGRVLMLGNYRLDQWLLGALVGAGPLGLYSAAVAWSEGLFLLPTAVSSVQRPDLARAEPVDAARQAAQGFRITVTATLPLVAGLLLIAPLLCVGLLGEDFRGSVLPLRVLALGAPGIVALKVLGNALTAQGLALRESAATGAAFVTIVVLDVALVPTWAGTGAAIASTIGYTVGGLVVAVVFLRSMPGASADLLLPGRRDVKAITRVVAERRRRRAPARSRGRTRRA
jgi:O-antigen/teichoic acid export membrane protein